MKVLNTKGRLLKGTHYKIRGEGPGMKIPAEEIEIVHDSQKAVDPDTKIVEIALQKRKTACLQGLPHSHSNYLFTRFILIVIMVMVTHIAVWLDI